MTGFLAIVKKGLHFFFLIATRAGIPRHWKSKSTTVQNLGLWDKYVDADGRTDGSIKQSQSAVLRSVAPLDDVLRQLQFHSVNDPRSIFISSPSPFKLMPSLNSSQQALSSLNTYPYSFMSPFLGLSFRFLTLLNVFCPPLVHFTTLR